MRYCFVVFLVLQSFFAFSKEHQEYSTTYIDSLMNSIEESPNDSLKVEQLCNIAWKLKHSAPEKSLYSARLALEIATSINFERGIANSNHSLGMVYWYLGEYSQATQFFFAGMRIREKLGNALDLARSYNNVGNVFFYQKKYDKALLYYERSRQLRVDVKDSIGIIYSLNNLGDISVAKNKYEEALQFYEEAYQLAEELEYDEGKAFTAENLGNFQLGQQAYIPAYAHFKDSYEIHKKRNHSIGVLKGLNGLAQTLVKQKRNIEKSIAFSKEAIALAKKIKAKRLQAEAQGNLAEALALAGNYKQAFSLEQKTRILENQILDESREKAIVETEIQYNVENHKSAILLQENQLLQKQKQLSQLQMFIVICFLIGTIIIAGLIYSRFKEQAAMYTILEKNNEELEKSNQALERFAYAASHDLKEPLRTIGSFVTLLKRRYDKDLDEEGREYVGFIVSGINRMYVLLEDLLEYSRLLHVKDEIKEVVDFNKIVAEVQASLGARIKEKEVIFEINEMPSLVSNSSQIQQLFQNLINNAIKFNDKESPMVAIQYEQVSGEHLFAVKDNGLGIDPTYKEQIFEVFKRLSREGYEGTGVGLAICKKIVEQHHGKIWVDSKEGEGSTFYFSLPNNQN